MEAIDWTLVNWFGILILAGIVFIAALLSNLINLIFDSNPVTGAIIAAAIFGAAYIGWTYYPHGIDLGQEALPSAGATISQ